ncbi:hypothetical protein HHI36_000332, partial [Cryptolaemus montrouzieri]
MIDGIPEERCSDSEKVVVKIQYSGKIEYKWSKNPPAPSRICQHNTVRQRPGLIGPAASKSDITTEESFELLVDYNIIQIINNYTNEKINDNSEKTFTDAFSTINVSVIAMKSFIELSPLIRVFQSGHEDVEFLWATDETIRDIFG